MEIILAQEAGFCFGVNRAMDLALEAGNSKKGKIATLGPLIHNPQAVKKLEKAGVEVERDIERINQGTIIIRSHGVPPAILEKAKEKDLKIINATCPFVKRAQQKSKELKEDGYQVVISGDKNHPEVVAILGSADNEAIVIEDEDDFDEIKDAKKVGVVAQTTQSLDDLQKLSNYLLKSVSELKIYNTICTTTGQRQDEAAQLAQKVDLMIVIGGRNSANTNRLAEICREEGVITYHIEEAEELKKDWFENIKKVGITAGASTPNWIIREVVSEMTEEIKENQELKEEEVEVTEEVEEQEVEVTEGEEVVEEEEVVETGEELEETAISKEVEEQEVEEKDTKDNNEEGWEKVTKAFEDEEIIEVEVTREVKGGLVAYIYGLRGFIPASHVAIEYVEDLGEFVGKTLELKVIEVERENNNVVLSRKAILEAATAKKKEEILNSLEQGQEIEGVVTKLVDFGAFVDLGGVEGLLHISEISWDRIGHPSDVLEEGEELKVKILGVEPKRGRVSLGLKQIQPDPWEEFLGEFKVDDVVQGRITKTVDFGAFMEIKPGVEGLIHISELAHRHVAAVEDVVNEGDEVEVKIINIKADERRVGLSIKELEEPEPKPKQKAKSKSKPRSKSRAKNEDKGDGMGVTLGDVFGDVFDE